MRATMLGSDINEGDAGSSRPRDPLTMPIEFSTVTIWSRPSCTSRSDRPMVGSNSASSPVTTCERLSFTATCAVSAHFCMAAVTNSVSGDAERKLPPIAMKTLSRPSCMAWMDSTTSSP